MRLRALLSITFLAVAATGCHRGEQAKAPAEPLVLRLVPLNAALVLVAPRLVDASSHLGALVDGVSRIPGAAFVQAVTLDLVSQLGADPRAPEGLRKLGLDPNGSAAAWLLAGGDAQGLVVALPVGDSKTVAQQLSALAQRAGAAGEPVVVAERREFRRADGALVLATTERDGFVVMTRRDPGALLHPNATLAGEATLTRLRGRLGEHQAFLRAPAGTLLGVAIPAESVVGLNLGAPGVSLRWVTPMVGELGAVVGAFGHPATVYATTSESWLSLELGGAPESWGTLFTARAPAELLATFAKAGINLTQDVFGNLSPGVSLGLALSRTPDFSQMLSFDPRSSNPFAYGRLRVLARVRDSARAKTTLQKLPDFGRPWGVDFAWCDTNGHAVLTGRYGHGETVSFALVDRTLLITGGAGEMEAALRQPPSPAKESAHALAMLTVDPGRLAHQVDDIPSSAYGGLSGLTARSIFSRVVEPLRRLGVASVTVDFDADVLTADVHVPLTSEGP